MKKIVCSVLMLMFLCTVNVGASGAEEAEDQNGELQAEHQNETESEHNAQAGTSAQEGEAQESQGERDLRAEQDGNSAIDASTPDDPDSTSDSPAPDPNAPIVIPRFNGFYYYWFGIVPSGGLASLNIYNLRIFEGSAASLFLALGAGVLPDTHYRGADGEPFGYPAVYNALNTYGSAQFNLAYSVRFQNNFPVFANFFLIPFLKFRGYSAYRIRDAAAGYPERTIWYDSEDWFFRHEFLGGLDFSNISRTQDAFAKLRGFYSSLSLGYAIGSSPRINLDARYYTEIARADVAMLEFRGRFVADFLFDGARFDDYSYIGGNGLEYGLGGTVRGFEEPSYASPIKTAINLEMHLIFKAFDDVILNPGFMLFVDAGVYGGEPNWGIDPGFLMSTGAAVSFDFLGFTTVRAELAFPLVGQKLDSRIYKVSFYFSDQF